MDNLVSIIVVNYNGASDTIDCLESIYSSNVSGNLRVVLIDNSSSDSSVQDITSWINNNKFERTKKFKFGNIIDKEVSFYDSDDFTDIFLKCDQNYGFAIANNIGISFSLRSKAKYIMLLNNDTVVHESSISYMLEFFENSDAGVLIPQIRLFYYPEKIWNCGGKLTWYGSKAYYYANQYFSKVNDDLAMEVSFFTGCAVLFKIEVFEKVGLLSEDYFFGTEDLNFSQRLAQSDIKAYCLMKSIIYHKVGQSIGKENLSFSILNHYLGHFINQKKRSSFVFWIFWVVFYSLYIILMLFYRYRFSFLQIFKILYFLIKYSFIFNNVGKNNYLYIKNKLND